MRYSVIAAKALVALGLIVLPVLAWSTPAGASSSTVQVRICAAPSTASLVVDSPVSDSTVNTKTIQVKGQVTDVSQISLYVNGVYSSTTAIGSSQTTFTISATLSEGTNTITLEAIDVCNIEHPSAAVVVSYVPDQPPSQGGETPTETDPGTRPGSGSSPSQGGGVRIGLDDNSQSADNFQVSDGLSGWLRDLIRITDIATLTQGNMLLNILRLIAVLAGLFLIIGASGAVGLIARWRQGEVKTWQLISVQLAGLLLVLLALIVF